MGSLLAMKSDDAEMRNKKAGMQRYFGKMSKKDY